MRFSANQKEQKKKFQNKTHTVAYMENIIFLIWCGYDIHILPFRMDSTLLVALTSSLIILGKPY